MKIRIDETVCYKNSFVIVKDRENVTFVEIGSQTRTCKAQHLPQTSTRKKEPTKRERNVAKLEN